MKQIISIADIATILQVLNNQIHTMEQPFNYISFDEDAREKNMQKHMECLKTNSFYQSLLHAKKSLEGCNIEIEVPDLKVSREEV